MVIPIRSHRVGFAAVHICFLRAYLWLYKLISSSRFPDYLQIIMFSDLECELPFIKQGSKKSDIAIARRLSQPHRPL